MYLGRKENGLNGTEQLVNSPIIFTNLSSHSDIGMLVDVPFLGEKILFDIGEIYSQWKDGTFVEMTGIVFKKSPFGFIPYITDFMDFQNVLNCHYFYWMDLEGRVFLEILPKEEEL